MSDREFSPLGRKFEAEDTPVLTRCVSCLAWVYQEDVSPRGRCYQCEVSS